MNRRVCPWPFVGFAYFVLGSFLLRTTGRPVEIKIKVGVISLGHVAVV
jgi:hypothetical protein